MKRVHGLLLGVCMLLVLGWSTAALGATLTGSITNLSGQAGRVHLRVFWAGGGAGHWGRSVINGASAYAIRGVPAGSYVVAGFIDKNNDGIPNISEGFGFTAPFTIDGAGTVVSGSTALVLNPQDPAAVVPVPVHTLDAMPLDGGVLLLWDSPQDDVYDLFTQADSFRVEWSSNNFVSVLGTRLLTAGGGFDDGIFFVPNLTNGVPYQFRVTSIIGTDESAPVETQAIPSAPVGGWTVSGTVNLNGISVGGDVPLIPILESPGGESFFLKALPSFTNGTAFSIGGVPDGYYYLQALVDVNKDNRPSAGDYWTNMVTVTVSGGNVGGKTLTVSNANARAYVEAEHTFDAAHLTGEYFSVAGLVESGAKRPVNVYLTGPAFSEGVDVAWDIDEAYYWQWNASRPQPTDTYSFLVYYTDGTSETLTANPPTVYNAPVATNVTPSGTILLPAGTSSYTPTQVSWAGNESLPAGWVVDVGISGWDGGFWWEPETMPAPDETSVAYDGPPLEPGDYNVLVKFCEDWNWSCVTRAQKFSVVTGTAATPASLTVPAVDSDGNGYMVTWGASATPEVSYVLEEATDSAFTDARVIFNGYALSMPMNGRSLYQTYYYRVKATRPGYADSAWRTAGNGCAVPGWLAAKPVSLAVPVADWNGDGGYTVSWGASATPGVSYVLEEASNPAFYVASGLRVAYQGTERSAAISGRETGKTYYYRVKAVRPGYRESVYQSNAAGCAVPGSVTVAPPPTLTVPNSDGDGAYTVTWGASATPGVSYVLEEASNPNFTVGLRLAYSGTAQSRAFSGRPQNVTYYYRVKAVQAGARDSAWRYGYKGCALPGSATVDTPVTVSVPASDPDGGYAVSWSASLEPGVKYFVQEATDAGFTQNLRTAYFGVNTTANIGGRPAGKSYYYRVQAVKPGLVDSNKKAAANGCAVGAVPQ